MKKEKLIAGLLACTISLGVPLGGVYAAADSPEDAPLSARIISERNLSLLSVKNRSIYAYERYSAYVLGKKLSVSAIRINGIDYISARAAAEALGASYGYTSETRTATVRIGGVTLTATDGNYTVYAADRALFSLSPAVIMSDGRMYIPASTFAKAFGLSLSNDGALRLSGSVRPLAHASRFYRDDEVFWLARIIHAESAGEPLLGQIAVGNVVLNRVKHKDFPNTIYGVIFDRVGGVQFSPVINGSIYREPTYQSIIAARICLDGFTLSDDIIFFLQPEKSTSAWIPKNRPYAFTVENHWFFK
jgi:N-acetylmuramoyl-L-alanine amidase